MRRWTAWILVFAWLPILVSGCGTAPTKKPSSRAAALTRYVDPASWSLRYPVGLSLERSTSGPLGMAIFTEVTVANFVQGRAVRTGKIHHGFFVGVRPPLDRAGRFPANGVAFRMLQVDGGPGPIDTVADSRFPIAVATFRRPQYPGFSLRKYTRLGVPRETSRPVQADGQAYTAELFVGRSATRRERAEIDTVARSLVFPRLHPGELAGDDQVVGLERNYPVGSITLVYGPGQICKPSGRCREHRAPFYLVHAPGRLHQPDLTLPCTPASACTPTGAFYAIGWKWEDIQGGYRSACDLRLDKVHDQFYCTNSSARWDRVGRVLRRPAGARMNDPLQFTFAKVTWDGHVAFVPGLDEPPPAGPVRSLLWPAVS